MARSKIKSFATLSDAEVAPDALARLAEVSPKLAEARQAISLGKVAPAETQKRMALFKNREAHKREVMLGSTARQLARAGDIDTIERIVGSNDILSIDFLYRGLIASKSVGCIGGLPGRFATGFLVAPNLLMTNNHVFPNASIASASTVEFELLDPSNRRLEFRTVDLEPGRFWFTDQRLDVTIVSLAVTREAAEATSDLGWHPMLSQQGKIRIGDPVNIIQHPGGRPKSVVVHNSNLLHLENETKLMPYAWYDSDTEPGSSGSPVFNRHWEVVAVHRRSVPRTNKDGELLDVNDNPIPLEDFKRNPNLAVWIANEGSRTSQIVNAIENAGFKEHRHASIRDELLLLWEESRNRNQGQTIDTRSETVDDLFAEAENKGRRSHLKVAPSQVASVEVNSEKIKIQISIHTDGQ